MYRLHNISCHLDKQYDFRLISDYIISHAIWTNNMISDYITSCVTWTNNMISDYITSCVTWTNNMISDYIISHVTWTNNMISDYITSRVTWTNNMISDYIISHVIWTNNMICCDWLFRRWRYTRRLTNRMKGSWMNVCQVCQSRQRMLGTFNQNCPWFFPITNGVRPCP